MLDTFILYAPGAGGNHLKNLLCLSEAYANSHELDQSVYDAQDRCPGEVWCVGGRNLQPMFFDRMHHDASSRSILIAHFGELAQHQHAITTAPQPQLVIITLPPDHSRRQLQHRQQRLGQNIHPYWLDEELPWCYTTRMYQTYFEIPEHDCIELDLGDFWQPDFCTSPALDRLEMFLRITVPRDQAHTLHHKWMCSNFGQ